MLLIPKYHTKKLIYYYSSLARRLKYLLKGIYVHDTVRTEMNTILMTPVPFIQVQNPGHFLAGLYTFMYLHCSVSRNTVDCIHVHSTVLLWKQSEGDTTWWLKEVRLTAGWGAATPSLQARLHCYTASDFLQIFHLEGCVHSYGL